MIPAGKKNDHSGTRRRRHNSRPLGAGGFTLIEVLLAFVVFALSFTVVLEILSGSMRNTMRAREYTEIALIAQSVMDQVGLDIPLEPGVSNAGELGDYRWQLEVSSYDGEAANSRTTELSSLTGIELLQVEFTITWGTYPREHSNRFSTVKAVLANRQGTIR